MESIPACVYSYIRKRRSLKEKKMELFNQIYDFLSFLRPYKFIIMGVSLVFFIICIVLANRARRRKNELDYDD